MIAVRLSIEGRVQGVGYRLWLLDEATARGLRGWVRNRRDGSVEALLIGDPADVAAVEAACRRGPRMAHVQKVERHAATDDGAAGFRQMPTM